MPPLRLRSSSQRISFAIGFYSILGEDSKDWLTLIIWPFGGETWATVFWDGEYLYHTALCAVRKVYFSAQPNKLRPILKFRKYFPVEHIFVPACSSVRKIHFFKF